jgi:hypothetical protein
MQTWIVAICSNLAELGLFAAATAALVMGAMFLR